MKKTIITIFIIAVAAISANAQNTWHRQGYRFNAGLSATIKNQWEASTTHGYAFGNGLFVGGGAAFHYDDQTDKYITPVFADLRWSLLDRTVSPFVEAKCGAAVNVKNSSNTSFYFLPTVGLDIWHFSIFAGYEVMPKFRNGTKLGISLNF